MIIKAKLLPRPIFMAIARIVLWFVSKRFNKLKINPIAIHPNKSYILMCNHLGFWDGFWACYLAYYAIHKENNLNGFYMMVLKKQIQKNPWIKYFGAFSIVPHSKTSTESLTYAAEILNTPGNLLIIFPQGNLESQHVRHIEMKDGIKTIMSIVKGSCQLIWSSNLTEYFESLKPSVYFHMLDCGTEADFDFEALKSKINHHHKDAIKKQFRFTTEE